MAALNLQRFQRESEADRGFRASQFAENQTQFNVSQENQNTRAAVEREAADRRAAAAPQKALDIAYIDADSMLGSAGGNVQSMRQISLANVPSGV